MSHPGDVYLETQVLTAPPQKLQLMLLEGALRHGRRAATLLRDGHQAAAGEALLRSQEIITELMAGLKPEAGLAVVRQVAGIYVFVHRSLVKAQFRGDAQALDEALRVLELECETWRQVCSQMDRATAAAPTAPVLKSPVPRPAFLDAPHAASPTSMSFEA